MKEWPERSSLCPSPVYGDSYGLRMNSKPMLWKLTKPDAMCRKTSRVFSGIELKS